MGREKTGRPKDIDAWKARQYLDLQQRKPHIPPGTITWDMLTDSVKRLLTLLPTGRYGGDGSTFDVGIDELGRVVFIPIVFGGGQYGLCVYGAAYGLYGTAKYGETSYGSIMVYGGKYDNGKFGESKYK